MTNTHSSLKRSLKLLMNINSNYFDFIFVRNDTENYSLKRWSDGKLFLMYFKEF